MEKEENLNNGRQKGSKNKKVIPLDELVDSGFKGIMLTGFTISNNKLRMTIATELGPTAALLYIQLYSHKNQESGKCFPTIEVLSKETGISERKVSEIIGQLCEEGYIIVRSGGRHFANTYWFPYEPHFDSTDIEVLMAYRRKNIFKKKKAKPEEALREINKENKKFAYSKEVKESLQALEETGSKKQKKRKQNIQEDSLDELPF